MAIATIVTRGYGNGTYSGTIPLVVTRGYSIGEAIIVGDGTAVLNLRAKMSSNAANIVGMMDNSALNASGAMSSAAINVRSKLYEV